MRVQYLFILPLALVLGAGCTNNNKSKKESESSFWVKPEMESNVVLGEKLEMQIQVPANKKIDSVVYWVDASRWASSPDARPLSLPTDSLPLGNRMITAKIYSQGNAEEINTNIVLRSSLVPEKFTYKVEKVFDHDTSSYTQGLEYHDGYFYESDGGNSPETGYSSLRKVEPASGKVLQQLDLPKNIFAEGITVIDGKIIQLTWLDNIGFVYDKNSFKKIGEFPYQNSREGWGLCFDGHKIYKSDGTNLIYFLNKDNYREEGYIEVYDQNGPVNQLNELEYINGKLYANVYGTNRIVIINPKNGQVTGEADLTDLLPKMYYYPNTDVLNGIAWDSQGKRLLVTGKKWAKLFQIKLVPVR